MIKKITIAIFVFYSMFALSIPCHAKENMGAYILMERDTGQVIKGENENARMPIASTTKIMTAVIALEMAEPDDFFTVSKNAQDQEGSSIYLREGDRITVQNLLYGLLLNSGNDAAVAIAEGVSGSVEAFTELMNGKAAELGCKNTHFKNPSGLNEEEHYSTAYDLARITAYALEFPLISKIMSTKYYNIEQNGSITYLKNHNKLLWQYEYCTGGKTGFTKLSGRCLVATAEKDGIRLIAVTLNCPDDWREHKELFDYGFSTVKKVTVIEKGSVLAKRKLNGTPVGLVASENVELPGANGKKLRITAILHIKDIKTDINVGDFVGYADICCNGKTVKRLSVESGQQVKRIPIFSLEFFKKKFFGR